MKRKLNGLIYLHRISDPRVGGQSRRNLEMFRKLCGTAAYENVVIVTTFWDKVTAVEGIEREAQLKSTVFKDLIEGGARLLRHQRTQGTAQMILNPIFMLTPRHVRLVEEIREEGRTLENTAAGSMRREEVERIIVQCKKEMADILAEFGKAKDSNVALRRELEKDRREAAEALERIQSERKFLKDGLVRVGAQRKRHTKSSQVLQGRLRNLDESTSAWQYDSYVGGSPI